MTPHLSPATLPDLPRLSTRNSGLDRVLGGGLLAGDTYLVTGEPGTGKTTLGNQLAFSHVAAGGRALVATLQTETHDRMLAHLRGFRFVDPGWVGERLSYVSLLGALQEGGLDAVLGTLVAAIRTQEATLLVVDGAGAAETFAATGFDYGRFLHGLQARTALLGCTVVLLSGNQEASGALAHVDGVLQLFNDPSGSRDLRWLRVAKLRGSDYLNGRNQFTIGTDGVTVFPRLEAALAELTPAWQEPTEPVAFGVPDLDAMLVGGLALGTTTQILGTPGAGKTMLGLHFLAEGARLGEPGLMAGFQETGPAVAATADRAGMGLGPHLASGLVQVLWRAPLELSPDAWAWQLLDAVEEHQPRRLVIDAFTDLVRLFADPQRIVPFAQALTNALRTRRVTSLFILEIDTFVGPRLDPPVPTLSATMDSGLLLRTVELGSSLRRLISVLKHRQQAADPTIREFVIGPHGITVGEPFDAADLLTGSARPLR
ncbi:MAG: Circadian clock protein KaiC [Chloroflexota bacterium]|nr:Circadian clock protein KaiC [Chloroflexota bacterium]